MTRPRRALLRKNLSITVELARVSVRGHRQIIQRWKKVKAKAYQAFELGKSQGGTKSTTITCKPEGSAPFKMKTKGRVHTGDVTSKALIVEHNNSSGVINTAIIWRLLCGSLWKSPHRALCVSLHFRVCDSVTISAQGHLYWERDENGSVAHVFTTRNYHLITVNQRIKDQSSKQRTESSDFKCEICWCFSSLHVSQDQNQDDTLTAIFTENQFTHWVFSLNTTRNYPAQSEASTIDGWASNAPLWHQLLEFY